MNFSLVAKICRLKKNNGLQEHWPRIETCLVALQIDSRATRIAALATVAIETAYTFRPIREFGSDKYLDKYDTGDLAARLGNTPEDDDDGQKYCGRGFIQITGRANYEMYGKQLGIDLVANPDGALDPDAAAAILASFFKDHGIHMAAGRGDWRTVRRRINGGTNGLKEFLEIVKQLEETEWQTR